MKLLGIDVSSTHIGWCYTIDNTPSAWGVIIAKGSIAERCRQAYNGVAGIIAEYGPDAVAIESGVSGGFMGAALVQSEVRGVIRLAVRGAGLLDLDISPTEAKKSLTGFARVKGVTGTNEKRRIIDAAMPFMSADINEHMADAYAVAHAASKKVVVHHE